MPSVNLYKMSVSWWLTLNPIGSHLRRQQCLHIHENI